MFRPRLHVSCAPVAVTVSVLAAVLVVPAAPAAAEPATPAAPAGRGATVAAAASVASATPLPTTQVDGVVWAQTTVGTTVYAVGSFSSARPARAARGTGETPRGNILAYDIRTGVLSTTFVHTLNAQAKTIVASADGSRVYVGGQFTTVDGQSRPRIAAFSTASGALLSYNPRPNYTVEAITATASTVWFGGSFASVGGVARTRLAATDTSGTLLPWAPTAGGTVRGLVAVPANSRVYAAGSFSTFNGGVSHGVSAVDATSGATIAVPVTNQILATDGNSTSVGVSTLRTDGTRIYGGGYHYLKSSVAQFEGTFALDPASGSTVWVNDCWGDTYDTAPVAGTLYVASHVHDCTAAGFSATPVRTTTASRTGWTRPAATTSATAGAGTTAGPPPRPSRPGAPGSPRAASRARACGASPATGRSSPPAGSSRASTGWRPRAWSGSRSGDPASARVSLSHRLTRS